MENYKVIRDMIYENDGIICLFTIKIFIQKLFLSEIDKHTSLSNYMSLVDLCPFLLYFNFVIKFGVSINCVLGFKTNIAGYANKEYS